MREVDRSSFRGILNASAGRGKFSLSRFESSLELKPFIEHYWVVRYEMDEDTSYKQTVLSYPNVHLAFEQDIEGRRSLLYGIPRLPFVRELRGSGRVLGIKFRAGGFYPFWEQEISILNGATISAAEIFGPSAHSWADDILDAGDDAAMARQAEIVLAKRLPDRDTQAELAAHIVEEVKNDRSIIKVEQLCMLSGLSIRQLQRLFRKYIGVTPKWVIKRFRLQEAAERLEQENSEEWVNLAIELGYFDQAHFIKDFKAVIGQSPAAYRKGVLFRRTL